MSRQMISSRLLLGVLFSSASVLLSAVCPEAGAAPIQPEGSPTAGQSRNEPSYRDGRFRMAQNADGLAVKVMIDAMKNDSYRKADDQFASFVYAATVQGNTISIQLASKEIVGTWKGNRTLREIGFASKTYFEDAAQFAPVFLLVDVSNDRTTPVQVKSAYVSVSESATDLQPYLEIGSWGRLLCGDGTYAPTFDITNSGWGPVRNARLIYSFGTATNASPEFTSSIGTFDQKAEASVDDGIKKSSLNIDRAKDEKFKCASKSQLPACLAKLKTSGIFGNLSNSVSLAGPNVQVEAAGRIEYEWLGIDQTSNQRSSPFAITIPILHFELEGAECGAPGPVDRTDKPLELSLDRKNYRLPIDWRGQLAARQNKRIGLSLSAPKASHHVLKIALELTDGSTVTSMPIDISYFKPRIPAPQDDNSNK
jgi:hypothetical protein